MLQAFDTAAAAPAAASLPGQRAQWLGLLARAPQTWLGEALGEWAAQPVQWLRAPETGLVMARARAGGTGELFNLGEVTVTRCALRLPALGPDGPMGLGYVMGRSHQQARWVATADALLQHPPTHAHWAARLLPPLAQWRAQCQAQAAADVAPSRVDFMTLAREASAAEEEDGE